MRILIPLIGSRGDVQPIVPVAKELERRGHSVLVGAPPNFVDFVARTGLPVRQFGPDIHALYSSPEGQRVLAAGNSFKMLSMVAGQMSEYADQMDDELIEISEGAEMILCTTFTEDRSLILAQARDLPVVSLHTYPSRTNSVYAPPSSLPHSWPTRGVVNRVAWRAAERLRTMVFRKYLNHLRAKLGLPSTWSSTESLMAERGIPELQIYDSALVPGLEQEWGAALPFVGFLWFGREEREAIGELAEQHTEVLAWADAGTPPIFFGFGSMPILDFAPVIELIRQICADTGQRALIGTGGAYLDPAQVQTGPDLKIVDAMAHDLIFPHCRAAMIHGGVGTLAECARAGLPTLVCSVSMDQPFWGHQVEQLGVGAHIPFPKLGGQTLRAAIDTVLKPETHTRAQELREKILQTPDGVQRVCDVVEKTGTG